MLAASRGLVLTGRECSWHDLGGVGMATSEFAASHHDMLSKPMRIILVPLSR